MKDSFEYIIPLVFNLIRYFIIAGIPFLFFYILFPHLFTKNKIQSRFAKKVDFIREIFHSMQTTFILTAMGLLILKTPLIQYTQVYDSIADYSLWWIPASVLASLVLHDTYFYWMHRIVHHPKLFKHIHFIHHKSVNPSPWTSYSFHFFEGVLEGIITPIILVLIPMHPIAYLLFVFSSFSINVYGHLGYEIAPKWFRRSFLFEIINSSTHHNMHHAKFNANYGIYFRIWDRLMGTEHPDYVKVYDEIQERRFGVDTSSPSFSLKRIFSMFLPVIFGFVMISVQAQNTSIEGKWRDNKEGGIILIYKYEGLYYGQLISTDNAKVNMKIQKQEKIIIMKGFQQKTPLEYCCGTIYQHSEKRTVTATLSLEDQNTLKIIGRYGVFKSSRIWKRI